MLYTAFRLPFMYIKGTQKKKINSFLLNTGKVSKHTIKEYPNFICYKFFRNVIFFCHKYLFWFLLPYFKKNRMKRIVSLFSELDFKFKEIMPIVKHLLQNEKSKPSNHFIGVGCMPAVSLWNCPENTNSHWSTRMLFL